MSHHGRTCPCVACDNIHVFFSFFTTDICLCLGLVLHLTYSLWSLITKKQCLHLFFNKIFTLYPHDCATFTLGAVNKPSVQQIPLVLVVLQVVGLFASSKWKLLVIILGVLILGNRFLVNAGRNFSNDIVGEIFTIFSPC